MHAGQRAGQLNIYTRITVGVSDQAVRTALKQLRNVKGRIKPVLNGNIRLLKTNGTSLAADIDVFQPELAPAVSSDFACRSTRVKCDFQTSGVKASILQAEDGDRQPLAALLCKL